MAAVGRVVLFLLVLSGPSHCAASDGAKPDGAKILQALGGFIEAVLDYAVDESTDDPDEVYDYDLAWLSELFGVEEDPCDPNPCLHDGTCEADGDGDFKCSCPRPYSGSTCQLFRNYCKGVRCGRGDCVLIPTPPYYECKCKVPFQPPNCRTPSACQPDPCMNGGSCQKGRTRSQFTCLCPPDFSGTFCEIGPGECYVGDGESYRGFISRTVDGEECLPWNHHLIPYKETDGSEGLGSHNYCRNPDDDDAPWCFIKEQKQLNWNYCNITECDEPPTVTSTVDETAPPPVQFQECGQPYIPNVAPRIFGGKKARPAAHPWQASLQVRTRHSELPFSHHCGGILIDSCWVLTAAHCIDQTNDMQVELGGVRLDKKEESEQIIPVRDVIVHEDYREEPDALYSDIALLRLKAVDGHCANETKYVKTACLPTVSFTNGTKCTISGWGVTEKDERGTDTLLEAKVRLIAQMMCNSPQVYDNRLDATQFCAGKMEGGVDTCQGDSGGPLMCASNGTHYIYGVVSWGDNCGKKNKPGVYARVDQFIDWIEAKMRTA
ncbi:hyaluronan-binding protein 2 [Denticeps clupeoides]|uniref:hyaluronan-binding protein 2 n=1 Tax=Denticeps clupeoides TaxID=299321 RepID=UPI0010A493F8|nr:hyaluronan-binding protein 2 [Denticeps clupeoides]